MSSRGVCVDSHSANSDALNKAATICWVAGLEDDNQCPLSLPASSAAETRPQPSLFYNNHSPECFDSEPGRISTGEGVQEKKLASKLIEHTSCCSHSNIDSSGNSKWIQYLNLLTYSSNSSKNDGGNFLHPKSFQKSMPQNEVGNCAHGTNGDFSEFETAQSGDSVWSR